MKHLLIIVIAVLLFSCGDEPDMILSPPTTVNIVSGIFLTTEYGPDEVGQLGNPHRNIRDGEYFSFYNYPNPSNGRTVMEFIMSEPGNCNIWIENAYPSKIVNIETGNYLDVPEHKDRKVIRNLFNEDLEMGRHNVVWNARDDSGEYVPTGFYRAFLQINDEVFFVDILIAWEPIPGTHGTEY